MPVRFTSPEAVDLQSGPLGRQQRIELGLQRCVRNRIAVLIEVGDRDGEEVRRPTRQVGVVRRGEHADDRRRIVLEAPRVGGRLVVGVADRDRHGVGPGSQTGGEVADCDAHAVAHGGSDGETVERHRGSVRSNQIDRIQRVGELDLDAHVRAGDHSADRINCVIDGVLRQDRDGRGECRLNTRNRNPSTRQNEHENRHDPHRQRPLHRHYVRPAHIATPTVRRRCTSTVAARIEFEPFMKIPCGLR